MYQCAKKKMFFLAHCYTKSSKYFKRKKLHMNQKYLKEQFEIFTKKKMHTYFENK